MADEIAAKADRILEEALETTGVRDPREFCRDRLRALKVSDADRYEEAVRYYRETLIPEVAAGEGDPLAAWIEYGRTLAQASAGGRTVSIDRTGRAKSYEGPDPENLVLHLPDDGGEPALPVGLPAEPSPAQRATYDVLVARKQRA